eukprot:SAG31_NODE_2235_length_6123_cov_2.723274_5_plen_115_part_00
MNSIGKVEQGGLEASAADCASDTGDAYADTLVFKRSGLTPVSFAIDVGLSRRCDALPVTIVSSLIQLPCGVLMGLFAEALLREQLDNSHGATPERCAPRIPFAHSASASAVKFS